MAIYPGFCGWWRINYEYAVFQLLIAYALAFRVSRAMFVGVTVSCISLFGITRIYRFDYLKSQFTAPQPLDGALIAAAIGVIVLIFYVFVNYERNWRASALSRFSLIGQHASNIIHDVKNLVATPALYSSTLSRKLASYEDPEVQEILRELQSSLTRTNKLIYDLNEMARLTEGAVASRVIALRHLVHEVSDLLQNQLNGVDLEIKGDLEIPADRALLYSVLLSVFMNSIDQFRRNKSPNPKILVEFEDALCRITDTGGGFDPVTLKTLTTDGRSRTTKAFGSGVGLYLVSNAMSELGGQATFKNSSSGAVVELHFAN